MTEREIQDLLTAVAEFAEVISLSRERFSQSQARREITKCRKLLKAAGVPDVSDADVKRCLPHLY